MGGFLAFVGFVGLVIAVVALVRGHLSWARIGSRKVAGAAVAGSLVVLAVGGALSPAATETTTDTSATDAAGSPSASAPPGVEPSPSVSPTATSDENEAADPEANPTSTASIDVSGLTSAPAAYGAKSACRTGDPLTNVYHPYRLQVVTKCSTVAGTVRTVRREDDGDVHIDLALDPRYTGMLDAGNRAYQHGWLVVEIVPADEPGCTVGKPPRPAHGDYDYGTCTGADETTPSVGSHVWVTGPYVIDHWHNWAEVHPAWRITATRPAAAPAAVQTTAPSAPPPPTHSALTCQAHMSNPSPSQYSTTDVIVQTGVGGADVSATAHYKTTDTTHDGTTGSNGAADIPFRISRATKGYTVQVDVTVSAGGATRTCSTDFTPR